MAAAAAAGGIVGGLMGMAQSALSAKYSREFATTAYKRTIKLRRSAYQDTIHDLEMAGINPMLAIGQGATGASQVPKGSQPDVSGIASNAQKGARLAQELKTMRAQEAEAKQRTKTGKQEEHKTEALKDQAHSTISLNQAFEKKALEDAKVSSFSAKNLSIKNKLDATKLPAAYTEGKFDESTAGQNLRKLNRTLRGLFGQKVPGVK